MCGGSDAATNAAAFDDDDRDEGDGDRDRDDDRVRRCDGDGRH